MRVRKGEAVPAAATRGDRTIELVCLAIVLALVMLTGRIVSAALALPVF